MVVVARFWGTGPGAAGGRVRRGAAIRTTSCRRKDSHRGARRLGGLRHVPRHGHCRRRARVARRAPDGGGQQGRQEIERLYRSSSAAFERASEAEAARRNEQLKAALLDALTHNLRTPLTAIKAAVTALIGAGVWTASRSCRAKGERELLQVIDEESDRLNRFIEGLSSADRPEYRSRRTLRSERLDDIVRAAWRAPRT